MKQLIMEELDIKIPSLNAPAFENGIIKMKANAEKNGNIWRMLMQAEVDVKNHLRNVIKGEKLLTDFLEGILSKKNEIRYESYKILLHISEVYPKVLYPKWEFLAVLLDSSNHYHRFIAINLLANLTSVDIKNEFDAIFDRFFSNIDCDKTMVAGHAVLNSVKISREKPNLQKKITYKLLNIDKMHCGKHNDLMKAYEI